MATPTLIVPGVGGEAAKTLVRAYHSADTSIGGSGDATYKPNTLLGTDTDGVYASGTGIFTVKQAGRYTVEASYSMSNANLDTTRNHLYISASLNSVGYTWWAPYAANDNFWTNNYNYHISLTVDCLVNDTFSFVLSEHGQGGVKTVRGGASNWFGIAKVG